MKIGMMNSKFKSIVAATKVVAMCFCAGALLCCGCRQRDIHTENTIELNGVSLFYAVDGPSDGRPIVLVHGNGGSHHSLDSLSAGLQSRGYLVYGLDSRGQGANEALAEYHYKDMAEDVCQFIAAMGLERPVLFGHSDGGIIGLELELMHPGTVSALAAAGANIFPMGVGEQRLAAWKAEVDSTGSALTRMMVEEPQIDTMDLHSISVPVLITAGEDDVILEEHTRLIASHIPGSELVILDGEGHSSYIKHGTKMLDLLTDFLERRVK